MLSLFDLNNRLAIHLLLIVLLLIYSFIVCLYAAVDYSNKSLLTGSLYNLSQYVDSPVGEAMRRMYSCSSFL